MPRRDPLREALARLSLVKKDPTSADSVAELRRTLSRESSHAVAKAAAITGEAGLGALVPDLVAAFERHLAGPTRADPGCSAKTSVMEALLRLDHEDEHVFLRGIRHVQMEPVLGGQVDTAVDLRGVSALGLARTSRPDVLIELGELLADPEAPARVFAARATGDHGRAAGIPLLRHKIRAGDEEPRVIIECLLALLHLDTSGSLDFVNGMLAPPPGVRRSQPDHSECAVVALGESRLPGAFPLLRDWHRKAAARHLERAALGALAGLRRDEAFDYLVSLVREAQPSTAREAVVALSAHRDESLRARVREAASGRPDITQAVERAFTPESG